MSGVAIQLLQMQVMQQQQAMLNQQHQNMIRQQQQQQRQRQEQQRQEQARQLLQSEKQSNDLNMTGKELFADGKILEALDKFENALKHRENATSKFFIAKCQVALQNYAAALGMLQCIEYGYELEGFQELKSTVEAEVIKQLQELFAKSQEELRNNDLTNLEAHCHKAKQIIEESKIKHSLVGSFEVLQQKISWIYIGIEVARAYARASNYIQQKLYYFAIQELDFCIKKHTAYAAVANPQDREVYVAKLAFAWRELARQNDIDLQVKINGLLPKLCKEIQDFDIDAAILTLADINTASIAINHPEDVKEIGYIPKDQIAESLSTLRTWHEAFKQHRTQQAPLQTSAIINLIPKSRMIAKQELDFIRKTVEAALSQNWHKLDDADNTQLNIKLAEFIAARLEAFPSWCLSFCVTYYLRPDYKAALAADVTALLQQELSTRPNPNIKLPIVTTKAACFNSLVLV